jgi:hypothetical protein
MPETAIEVRENQMPSTRGGVVSVDAAALLTAPPGAPVAGGIHTTAGKANQPVAFHLHGTHWRRHHQAVGHAFHLKRRAQPTRSKRP